MPSHFSHRARKNLGQHFLIDSHVIRRIVEAVSPREDDILCEIGPGLGALTYPLLEWTPHLGVIELDRDLVAHWEKEARLTVIAGDVLKVDFQQLRRTWQAQQRHVLPETPETPETPERSEKTPKLRIVGNLPYNISTPILFHLLTYATDIQDQHVMLQKEVVDRMVASPSTRAYGRLSVMLQWAYQMTPLMNIPPEAFRPAPRVNSSVVCMRPLPRAQTSETASYLACLETVVKIAFSQRRKLLKHTLGPWLEEKKWGAHFDLQRRAEEVTQEEYWQLAKQASSR